MGSMGQALSISEVAARLNLPEDSFHELISEGALSTTSDGGAIPRYEVMAYRALRSRARDAALNQMVSLGEEKDLPY